MSRGINKAIIVGHLGADPEVRYLPSGGAVTNISVATSQAWKDKQTGEMNERTEWHRVVFFNRLAEVAGEYLRKGSQVYVEGRIQTRKWQDRDGQDRYTTEIVGNEMQMLGTRGQNQGDSRPQQADYPQPGGQTQPPQQQPPQQQPPPAQDYDPGLGLDPDDDIPF